MRSSARSAGTPAPCVRTSAGEPRSTGALLPSRRPLSRSPERTGRLAGSPRIEWSPDTRTTKRESTVNHAAKRAPSGHSAIGSAAGPATRRRADLDVRWDRSNAVRRIRSTCGSTPGMGVPGVASSRSTSRTSRESREPRVARTCCTRASNGSPDLIICATAADWPATRREWARTAISEADRDGVMAFTWALVVGGAGSRGDRAIVCPARIVASARSRHAGRLPQMSPAKPVVTGFAGSPAGEGPDRRGVARGWATTVAIEGLRTSRRRASVALVGQPAGRKIQRLASGAPLPQEGEWLRRASGPFLSAR